MSETPPLPEAVEVQLGKIGRADLLVGIPSYNNARTIGHVVRATSAGLTKYFPDAKAVIVNSDGGSTDGTREIVAQAELSDPATILVSQPTTPIARIVTPYHGIPGKGSAFRTIFQIADRLDVVACAVVDSDLRSIRPEWLELLLHPIHGHLPGLEHLHDGSDQGGPDGQPAGDPPLRNISLPRGGLLNLHLQHVPLQPMA